jgi:transcription initiation factor TFIIH subunit 4
MRKRIPILPETVCEQIILWEKEIHRVDMEDAVLYSQFPTVEMFQLVENEMKERRIFLWSDPKRKMLIIKNVGFDLINFMNGQ